MDPTPEASIRSSEDFETFPIYESHPKDDISQEAESGDSKFSIFISGGFNFGLTDGGDDILDQGFENAVKKEAKIFFQKKKIEKSLFCKFFMVRKLKKKKLQCRNFQHTFGRFKCL